MPSSTLLSDNGVSSGSAGIKTTGGNDGVLLLQTTTSGGTATTAVTVDNAQNLGLGVTPSSTVRLDVAGPAGSWGIRVRGGGNGGIPIASFADVNGNGEVRIDNNGNLLVGTTTFQGKFTVTATGSTTIDCARTETTNSNQIVFRNGNGAVGSITTNGSSTAYNTSSDYRLKNSIAPMTGALAKVSELKPVTYKWNVDGSDGEGFIAHELAEVVPDCVTGEKDAVDAYGNPKYQGIDTSFLVATLTAAIQELAAASVEQQTQIEDQLAIITAQQTALTTLTARIEALEGAKA